jgi:hypothetical protein
MPPPVRIKLYGLIWLSKRGYLLLTAAAGLGLVGLFAFWCWTITPETPLEKAGKYPLNAFYVWRVWGPWLIAGGFLVGGVEAYFVLRRFRRAEAERRKSAADTKPKGT